MDRRDQTPGEAELFRSFLSHLAAAGWAFNVTETSANVYLVEGRDRAGRTVSRRGYDVESLLADCEADVASIERQGRPG